MNRPSIPEVSIRPAASNDSAAVRALVTQAHLPLDGIASDLADFLVAELAGVVVGVIGLESYGRAALLRSAVVSPPMRGTGLGEQLVSAILAVARSRGIEEVVLLTTTAEHWFPRFGFRVISRAEVSSALHESQEFQGACPASATVMRLALT